MVFYCGKLRVGTYVACVAASGFPTGGVGIVGLDLMTGASALKVKSKKLGVENGNDQSDDVELAPDQEGLALGEFVDPDGDQPPEEQKAGGQNAQINEGEQIQDDGGHDDYDDDGWGEPDEETLAALRYHAMLERARAEGLEPGGTCGEGLPNGPPSQMARQFHRRQFQMQTIIAFLAPYMQQAVQQVSRIFAHEHVPVAMASVSRGRLLNNTVAPAAVRAARALQVPPFERTPLYLFEQMKQDCRPGDVSYHQAIDRLFETAGRSINEMLMQQGGGEGLHQLGQVRDIIGTVLFRNPVRRVKNDIAGKFINRAFQEMQNAPGRARGWPSLDSDDPDAQPVKSQMFIPEWQPWPGTVVRPTAFLELQCWSESRGTLLLLRSGESAVKFVVNEQNSEGGNLVVERTRYEFPSEYETVTHNNTTWRARKRGHGIVRVMEAARQATRGGTWEGVPSHSEEDMHYEWSRTD